MNKVIAFATLSAIAQAPLAFGLCDISSTVESNVVPPDKLPLRNAIYQDLCKKIGGALVDGDNVALKDRLVFPAKQSPQYFTVDSVQGDNDISRLISKSKKAVVLVYIVEPNGRVSWAAMLDSSGEKQLDTLGISAIRALVYRSPVTLDGQPARVFQTTALYGPSQK